jgi:hypothetical protein
MVSYHLPAYVRVSVGTPEQNARFFAELPGALEGLVAFTPVLPAVVAPVDLADAVPAAESAAPSPEPPLGTAAATMAAASPS